MGWIKRWMNQLIVPISFTKIQFSKISSLWRRGKKSVGQVFPVESLFKPNESLYSRASFNCVGKIKHRETIAFKKPSCCFCSNCGKNSFDPDGKIWSFLALLFNPTFPFVFCHNWEISMVSMVFGLTLYGMEDKWSTLSLLCSPLLWVTLWADRRRRKAFTRLK